MNLIAKYNNTEKIRFSKKTFLFQKRINRKNEAIYYTYGTSFPEDCFLFNFEIISENTCVRKSVITKIEKINGVAIYYVKHFSGVEMKLLKDGFFYLFDI